MKRRTIFIAVMVAVVAMVVASTVIGAGAALFIKFDGIKGESTDIDHKDWTDISTVEWGVSVTRSTTGGGGATSRPVFSDLSWTQEIDKSIPPLFNNLVKGRSINDAKIDFTTRLSGNDSIIYFQMFFEDVFLTNLLVTGNTESRALTAGSFAYGKIKMIYTEYDAAGRKKGTSEAEYDLSSGKGSLGELAGLYALGISGPPGGSTIPIPATLWMLGAGLAGLAGLRRTVKR